MDPVFTPSAVAVAAAPAVAKAMAPKLVGLCSSFLKGSAKAVWTKLAGAFTDAVEQNYLKHSYFSSIVFPNKQLRLADYYVPLTLQSSSQEKEPEEVVVTHFPEDLFRRKKDILVVDSAGMGKSTLLKNIFLKAVETESGIPVFIELRKLKKKKDGELSTNSVVTEILNQLQKNFAAVEEKMVLKIIASGEFIFFFDGYDEIEEPLRAAITQDIIEFKKKSNKNLFLLSSREMPGLGAFVDFYRYNIKPLNILEAHNLIRKYSYPNSELAQNLIDKISQKESRPILEFLTNPLLVSLLYKAYEFKKNIPLKKHAFYRQVFEALFENHDLSKDAGELNRAKKSGLDMHNFELAMRVVGYQTFYDNKVEYAKDQLILILERCQKKLAPINFSPNLLLDDLTLAVPLFTYDGLNIRWQHKSLQEYFSALYISAADFSYQKNVLEAMFRSEKASSYLNFLGLFIDINPQAARRIIAPLLCNELIESYESKPLIEGVPLAAAKLRRSLTMDVQYVICSEPELEIHDQSTLPKNMKEAGEIIKQNRLDLGRASYTHAYPPIYGDHPERATYIRMLLKTYVGPELPKFLIKNKIAKITKEQMAGLPKYTLIDNLPDSIANLPEHFDKINSALYGWSEAVLNTSAINMDAVYELRDQTITEINNMQDEEFRF